MSTTHTATSEFRSLSVVVNENGQVRSAKGAFLGDVEGMESVGWTFAEVA